MKILFVASECAPIIKVGGLADVVGSLPKALKNNGIDVTVAIPFYETVKIKEKKLLHEKMSIIFDNKKVFFNIWKSQLPESNVPLLLIESDDYFSGPVYAEGDAHSEEGYQEVEKFLFFSKAILELAETENFTLIHCHDWHTSCIPLIKKNKNIKTLLTIHNIGHQGNYPKKRLNNLLEILLDKDPNCLREGIINADFVNTVSENYAKEILTAEFGFGLESFLKNKAEKLSGIINGIDVEYYNPEADKNIEENYSLKTIIKKNKNKEFLQKEIFGQEDFSTCVIGIVSRLADQKGFDLIEKIFPNLMKEKIQFILLGTGAKEYEDFFTKKSKEYPEKCFVKIGFDENFARKIYAGADIFLMPSYFEPCGLGQMIAMRYGTIPLVRAIGGLKDTVTEGETGFLFKNYDAQELLFCIKRTLKVFQDKNKWQELKKNAMKKDFSWKNSAKKYIELYNKIIDSS